MKIGLKRRANPRRFVLLLVPIEAENTMKAKHLITLHIAIIGFLFSSLGWANMFNFGKNKARFDWIAQVSAPEGYFMRVIKGTFYYHDEAGGLYIPEGASIGKGSWGNSSHAHVVGEQYKALPDRLDIRFFSFTENKLYQGSFNLPYEKILALFKEGAKGSRYGEDHPGYNSITAGIAPGGAVAVWVRGPSGTREVFFLGKRKNMKMICMQRPVIC